MDRENNIISPQVQTGDAFSIPIKRLGRISDRLFTASNIEPKFKKKISSENGLSYNGTPTFFNYHIRPALLAR